MKKVGEYACFSLEGTMHPNEDRWVALRDWDYEKDKERYVGGGREKVEDDENDKNENNNHGTEKIYRPSYFAMYDGHGGDMTVDYLIGSLHKNIINADTRSLFYLTESDEVDEEGICTAIKNGFEKTEKEILKYTLDRKDTSGSCAVVVIVLKGRMFVANVGDSRAVLGRRKVGVISPFVDKQASTLTNQFHNLIASYKALGMTSDQKATTPSEKKRMQQSGGWLFQGRVWGNLAVARSFGDRTLKGPDENPKVPQDSIGKAKKKHQKNIIDKAAAQGKDEEKEQEKEGKKKSSPREKEKKKKNENDEEKAKEEASEENKKKKKKEKEKKTAEKKESSEEEESEEKGKMKNESILEGGDAEEKIVQEQLKKKMKKRDEKKALQNIDEEDEDHEGKRKTEEEEEKEKQNIGSLSPKALERKKKREAAKARALQKEEERINKLRERILAKRKRMIEKRNKKIRLLIAQKGPARPGVIIAEPVIKVYQFHPKDDFVLLATDGLWDVLDNFQVVTMVGQRLLKQKTFIAYKLPAPKLIDTCKCVCNKARDRRSYDDITTLIFFLNDDGTEEPTTNRGSTIAANEGEGEGEGEGEAEEEEKDSAASDDDSSSSSSSAKSEEVSSEE